MNGRLYDPLLHRFFSPDNYVQDPGNTQNYNRYGYVYNSPLRYTDPSGELIRYNYLNGNTVHKNDGGVGGGDYSYRMFLQTDLEGRARAGDRNAIDEYTRQTGGYIISDRGGIDNFAYAMNNGKIFINGETVTYTAAIIGSGTLTRTGTYDMKVTQMTKTVYFSSGSTSKSWENSKLALDIGGGLYGALETVVRPGNQWLGANGKHYNNSWGGNQYTGSRFGAFKAAKMYKWAGRATVGVTALIGVVENL